MRLRVLMLLIASCSACVLTSRPIPIPATITDSIPETPTPTIEIVRTPIAGAVGPDNFPANVNPLTGLQVEDPASLDRRPMVVKISNAPPLVRPQAGIGEADLVFEHYAEGGLTRFSAVFYSHAPTRVGSIRSARLIDYELVPMYQGLLAFSGASTGVEEYINGSEFADRAYKGILYGLPYYWRDESIEVPHNLFTNVAALWDLAAEEGLNQQPNLHGMAFHAEPPQGSTGEASTIDIRYRATRVRWVYDAEIEAYRRFSDGQGHFDANSLEQVTTENVVVIFAQHEFTDIVESQFQDSVSYSIEIRLWFEGDAILLREGLRYDGRWVRPTREDMLGLRTDNGDLLYLKPGNTWFQVVRLPEQMTPEEEWVTVE